jgi:general nucleoside transport system permease protein
VAVPAEPEAEGGGDGGMTILITLLTSTLQAATPLTLAALGGVFSERAGVINIALEGIMLVGAWAAVYFSFLTGSAIMGLLGAVVAGMLIAAIHAVASINYKANQVVSGVAINLLASGFTEYMMVRVWETGQSPSVAKIPQVGPISLFVVITAVLVAVSQWVLWKTSWGLRLRAVGEHPLAAETVGVNVYRMRYWGVLLSGLFAGLAGASLSIGIISRFSNGMTAGRGFIALAAMIFGKWSPMGSVVACLLFGAADAAGIVFQILGVNVPNQFLQMAPYIITMLALAGVVGRSTPPAADGVPYDKTH